MSIEVRYEFSYGLLNGGKEFTSADLVQKWQMRGDQVFLFEMLEQLDRRVLQNVDNAAHAGSLETDPIMSITYVRRCESMHM